MPLSSLTIYIANSLQLSALAQVEGLPPQSSENLKRKNDAYLKSSNTSSKRMKHESKIWEPVGLKHIGEYEFQIDSEGYVIAYTDGSCFNNGRSNACAGYGVYFGDNHPLYNNFNRYRFL